MCELVCMCVCVFANMGLRSFEQGHKRSAWLTFDRFLIPAVSMSFSLVPEAKVTSVSTASLVVPLMSHTITRSSPQIAFSKLLLPVRMGKHTGMLWEGGA